MSNYDYTPYFVIKLSADVILHFSVLFKPREIWDRILGNRVFHLLVTITSRKTYYVNIGYDKK